MDHAIALDVGAQKRKQGGINEDSVAVSLLEEGHRDTERAVGVFVLADGAGGEEAGDIASYLATVEVTNRLSQQLWASRSFASVADDDQPAGTRTPDRSLGLEAAVDPLAEWSDDAFQSLLVDAIEAAHRRIVTMIHELDLETSHSTVVAGILIEDRLHYGWVGDSRAYVVNVGESVPNDRRLSRLTRDHSVVEELLERGEIDEIEAHVHRQGNRITQALGGNRSDDPETAPVAVDTNSVPLFEDDVVLFTSDGLIDAYVGAPELHERYLTADDPDAVASTIVERSVTDDEIRDVILEAPSLDDAAGRFVDLSNERGGKDNISVILFRPAGVAPPADVDRLDRHVAESSPPPS